MDGTQQTVTEKKHWYPKSTETYKYFKIDVITRILGMRPVADIRFFL